MNRHHSSDRPTCPPRDRLSCVLIPVTLRLQVFAEFFRIHVVRTFIHIHEFGKCSCLRNCLRSCNERVRYGYDNIPGLHSCSDESKAQCIGSASHTDAMRCLTESCEGILELLHHWATDEGACAESLPKHSQQFIFQVAVWGN